MEISKIVLGLIFAISLIALVNFVVVSMIPAPIVPISNCNYFIAANYYNSEKSLSYSLPELKKLISYLNTGENVYMSVYENGSNDNTKGLLKDFEKDLEIPHKFVTCGSSGYGNWTVEKILGEKHINKLYKLKPYFRYQRMAAIRNRALEPLYTKPFSNGFPIKVIFLNDIYFHAEDLLKLVHTNNGDFDIACGLDFYYQFYDVLVTRDIEGYWFSGYYPFTRHPESQLALKENKPFRVMSCWNGVIVLDAKGFLDHGIAFRGRKNNGESECECQQSECLLVCSDFFKAGMQKIFINPEVRVSYEWKYFMMHNLHARNLACIAQGYSHLN